MRFFLTVFLLLLLHSAYGQVSGLTYHFSFNNCTTEDAIGGETGDMILNGPCECGVDGLAFNIENPETRATLPGSISQEFSSDFTFSFYMWPRNTVENNDGIDIWSMGSECNSDTTFQIRYLPSENELRVLMSYQNRNSVELAGTLTEAHCWSYVVLTKLGQDFSLYIDNELVSTDFLPGIAQFVSQSPLFLSRGPCIDLPFIRPYEGFIDELRIYDRALSREEIMREDFFPNQIILDQEDIFLGESVFLENGGFCSNDYEWSPSTGLSDVRSTEPIATPEETTTYTLTINDRSCETRDSILIIVVDPSALDCADLLLPSAFTPNGDGRNDEFGISNGFILDELISFEVFDKWGGRMFYSVPGNTTWDGRAERGNDTSDYVMPGAYVYRVRYICQGEENQLNGVVNVIR